YAVDPALPGRIREGSLIDYDTTSVAALGGGRYKFNVAATTGLKAGDRYVELARQKDANLIYSVDSSNVSVINVTAYAGPGGFVIGVGGPINVINSRVLINAGRPKTTDA